MLKLLRDMVSDERGSVTLWNLMWLTGFCAFLGLAMDSNSAVSMKARLQSTADAAALAGVMKLKPTESVVSTEDAIDAATVYAMLNMDVAFDGNFLSAGDLEFGVWNSGAGTFTLDATPHNAMRVITRREEASDNALITGFLRVINFYSWDINAAAIAAVEYEQCMLDGLISASQVIVDSDNEFGDRYCVYGRDGLQLVNGNDFTGQIHHAYAGYGRGFSHECGFYLMGKKGAPPTCSMESNPGLEDAWFVSDAVHPTRLYQLDENGYPETEFNGDFIVTLGDQIDALVVQAQGQNHLLAADWRGTGTQPKSDITDLLQLGGAYYLECEKQSDVLELSQGDYRNLLLATNCLLELPGGSPTNPPIYEAVTFTSTSTASFSDTGIWKTLDHNIAVRGGNQLGTGCDGYGVRFLTESGIKFDGGNIHMGNEVNAGGTVGIDGGNDGASTDSHSMTVHALGDIIMTSSSRYALCDNSGPSADARPVYRLVQ